MWLFDSELDVACFIVVFTTFETMTVAATLNISCV